MRSASTSAGGSGSGRCVWTRRRLAWLAYAGTLVVGLLGVVVVVGAPWLRAQGFEVAGAVLHEAFRPVCHQEPARSFFAWGYPLAVCSRCSALLFGGVVGLILVPLARPIEAGVPRRRWLALAAGCCLLDVVIGWAGVPNTFVSRGVTGGLLGATTAFYLVPAMVAGIQELFGSASNGDGAGVVPGAMRNT